MLPPLLNNNFCEIEHTAAAGRTARSAAGSSRIFIGMRHLYGTLEDTEVFSLLCCTSVAHMKILRYGWKYFLPNQKLLQIFQNTLKEAHIPASLGTASTKMAVKTKKLRWWLHLSGHYELERQE